MLSACGGSEVSSPVPDAGIITQSDAGAITLALDSGAVMPDAEPAPPQTIEGPFLYPSNEIHSPITPDLVEQWQQTLAKDSDASDQVFAKLGDSITVSDRFLKCFDSLAVDLDGRDYLAETLSFFREGDASGMSPFSRDSTASMVGRTALWLREGSPSPLEQELEAISPAFSVMMFGTNDVGIYSVIDFADYLLLSIDQMLRLGVLPILSTIPPRNDFVSVNADVPPFNAAIHAIAQARRVPLINYHLALRNLPENGLGPDGIHPSSYRTNAGLRECSFGPEGLKHGYNQRNLRTLEALHRLKTTILDGDTSTIAYDLQTLKGAGTHEEPYLIESLPFSDARSTLDMFESRINEYPGCNADQDESGREVYYRIELQTRTKLRAMVLDLDPVDIDVHLLRNEPEGTACLERAHHWVEGEYEPGVYYFSLDTFVPSNSEPRAGEFLFVVLPMP